MAALARQWSRRRSPYHALSQAGSRTELRITGRDGSMQVVRHNTDGTCAFAPRLVNADPKRGAQIALQCKACHAVDKGAAPIVGPTLWGIVERPVGSHPGFGYSDGLKGIGGRWDYETLSRYLFDPQAMAPGMRMAFPGVKQDRTGPT